MCLRDHLFIFLDSFDYSSALNCIKRVFNLFIGITAIDSDEFGELIWDILSNKCK